MDLEWEELDLKSAIWAGGLLGAFGSSCIILGFLRIFDSARH